MPKQKDLKRLVRARMKKTGEAYSAARLQLLRKRTGPAPDYAKLAGMGDAPLEKQTGRTWSEWVGVLDAALAADKPHREIAAFVSSLGATDWWSQMVTVGYERIRGLRAKGQRRDGTYEASKSRTFDVPIERLFGAFAVTRTRRRWLAVNVKVRSARPCKTMRLTWPDDTIVALGFTAKGAARSVVAVQHQKLPDRSAADAVKKAWAGHFDRLDQLLS